MDEAGRQGAVDDEVVAAARHEAVVAVEPRGGDAHDGQQTEHPEMPFAIAGHDVEGCEEGPSGDAHGDGDDEHEREELKARERISPIAAGVGRKHPFAEDELAAADGGEVLRSEGYVGALLPGGVLVGHLCSECMTAAGGFLSVPL